MKSIVIYPENKDQLSAVQSFLEKISVKFSFLEKDEALTDWQKDLIEAGLQDIAAGKVISNDAVSKKAKAICLK